MHKRLALCVGINDYPGSGSDLSGCVNDATSWTGLLDSLGYEVITLLDGQATRANVVQQLRDAMLNLKFADRFIFTYSGHGSWIPDREGDEADARDEVLVMHDWESQGFLSDDDLFGIYQNRHYGVRVTAISDSCYSGTVARAFGEGVYKQPRFFPPDLLVPGATDRVLPRGRNLGSRPGTVLLSGCADDEVSYDAYLDGRYQGAMTHAAMSTFAPGQSMHEWHKAIRLRLPNATYDQTPQLQATYWQRRWSL